LDDDDFEDDSGFDDELDDDDFDDYEEISDFEYLRYKIISYLDKFGSAADENWTESEGFLTGYPSYLNNSENYTFNESDESYETYLKIYDSVVSSFEDYNLTHNETDYLKFLVIYYLNNYGNCSNYTWNESDEFLHYYLDYLCYSNKSYPKCFVLGASFSAMGSSSCNDMDNTYSSSDFQISFDFGDIAYNTVSSVVGTNSTDLGSISNLNNSTITINSQNDGLSGLLMVLFAILMMVLSII
ncbi:MAG: hypothetical protein UHW99_02780, partial [Methanobrevibacter sp.]|nr:hypothetical protein [Methanobrevibacter sp.]